MAPAIGQTREPPVNRDPAVRPRRSKTADRLTGSPSLDVNVNCLLPGTLDTPQNRKALPDASGQDWVKLEDLAHVILFLASDAARAIHGDSIPVVGSRM